MKYKWIIDLGHGGLDENGKYVTGEKKRYTFTGLKDPRVKKAKGVEVPDLTIYEGVVNRQIGAALVRMLKEKDIDFQVISEPVADTPIGARKAMIANAQVEQDAITRRNRKEKVSNPDGKQCIALSIHNNASSNDISGKGNKAKGCEIWTTKGEDVSDKVADFFAKWYMKCFPEAKFRSYTGKDGMHDKEANFTVITAPLPSLLVECGFYDNKEDALNMIDPAWIEDQANWLFKSILAVEKSSKEFTWNS